MKNLVSKDGKQFFEIDVDFDPQTGVDRSLDAAMKKGYQRYVDVTKDGQQKFTIPATGDSLNAALKKGYKEASQFQNDAENSEKLTPQIGAGEAAIRGVAQGATFNFADEIGAGLRSISPNETYDDALADIRLRNEAAQKQNPGSYGAGEVGAALLVPNPASKAGLVGRLAGAAGAGAVSSLGQSNNKSLEDIYGGLASGAAGGLLGEGVSKIASKVGSAASRAPEMARNIAGRQATKATNALKKDAAQVMKMGGAEKFGQELLDKGMVKFGDTAEDIGKRAAEQASSKGAQIGQKLEEYGEKGAKVPLDLFRQDVKSTIVKDLQKPGSPSAYKNIAREITDEVDNIVNDFGDEYGKFVTPQTANEIKGKIYDLVYRNQKNPNLSDKEKRLVANKLMERVDESIRSRFGKGEQDAFKKLKRDYSVATTAAGIGEDMAERAISNRNIPPSTYIMGAAGAAGGQGSGESGKLALIMAGLNQIGLKYGNSAAAAGFNKLAKVLESKPATISRQTIEALSEAAKRGNSSLAATHLMLMNRDPNYKKAIEQQQE